MLQKYILGRPADTVVKTIPQLPLGLQRRIGAVLRRLVSGKPEDPGQRPPALQRMFKPGIDDLVFVGLGQAIPTIFPFAELQAKLMARYLTGAWALPGPAEMERTIRADEAKHRKHFSNRPRHTMQLDWYVYEHDLVKREIPAGVARARSRYAVAGANP